MDTINIMISVNSNFILPAKVMIKSLSLNTTDSIRVFLLYSKLSKREIDKLKVFCERECNASFEPIYINFLTFFGSDLPLHGWVEEIY